MWKNVFESSGSGGSRNQDQQDPNLKSLISVGLAVALAAFFASLLPPPFFAPALSELLHFGALGAMLVAVVQREKLLADELTAWDQAAILLLLSLVSGLFVDPQAVTEALNEMAGQSGAPPA